MMRSKMHDVIVVGAGPIGSYTACLLAQEGLDVGVFEKNPFIGKDINCTGIVSAECIKKFDLPDEVILGQVNSIKAFSPSGRCLRYESAKPLAYIINRSLFDREINKMAVREGAEIHLNARVKEVNNTGGVFEVKVKTEGKARTFRSRTGVIATGFEINSLEGILSGPKDFLYGIQTDIKVQDICDIEVYFGEKVAPGSFGWIVPTDDNSAKVGLMTKENPAALLRRFLRNPLIAHRLDICENQIKCSPIPFGRIPKSYAERLIIVGEAAGQVKTTTGGGIYFGLLCSEIAVRTILKAVKNGDYSENLFQEYERTWRSRLEPELKAGMMLRNMFSRLSDRQIDLLIDFARQDGILPMIKKTDFDWHKDLISSILRHLVSKKIFGKWSD